MFPPERDAGAEPVPSRHSRVQDVPSSHLRLLTPLLPPRHFSWRRRLQVPRRQPPAYDFITDSSVPSGPPRPSSPSPTLELLYDTLASGGPIERVSLTPPLALGGAPQNHPRALRHRRVRVNDDPHPGQAGLLRRDHEANRDPPRPNTRSYNARVHKVAFILPGSLARS